MNTFLFKYSKHTFLASSGAGATKAYFPDLNKDMTLEVRKERCCRIWFLLGKIAYVVHLCNKNHMFNKNTGCGLRWFDVNLLQLPWMRAHSVCIFAVSDSGLSGNCCLAQILETFPLTDHRSLQYGTHTSSTVAVARLTVAAPRSRLATALEISLSPSLALSPTI